MVKGCARALVKFAPTATTTKHLISQVRRGAQGRSLGRLTMRASHEQDKKFRIPIRFLSPHGEPPVLTLSSELSRHATTIYESNLECLRLSLRRTRLHPPACSGLTLPNRFLSDCG